MSMIYSIEDKNSQHQAQALTVTVIRIHWIARKPTPYNNFLLRSISADPEIDLNVHFIHNWMPNHPWQEELSQEFSSRVFHKSAGLDRHLLQVALRESQSFFILGGFWFDSTVIALAQLLGVLKRPFALWTDTPNVKKQRWFIKRVGRDILLKQYFIHAYRIMGTGNIALQALEQMGCPSHKLVNFPFFVDLEQLKPTYDTNQSINKPLVFVSSGRLDNAHKGYDLAISALGLARQRTNAEFIYRIAGTGKDEQCLRALAEKHEIADRVEFLGWLESSQIREFYRSGHVLLHPSHFDPFPVSVLEAMAAGLAVIGSDQAGSVVERVNPGKNGFIHQAGNMQDLADKIVQLLTVPDQVLKLGVNLDC